jgi:hypothetical protein
VPNRDVTLVHLVDAGVLEGQAFVMVCPERLSPPLQDRLATMGAVRPRQQYARVARVAVCFRSDGGTGNCFGAGGAMLAAAEGASIIVPSLRKRNGGSVIVDDAADESEPFDRECVARRCSDMPAGFCTDPLRVTAVTPGCVIPDCRNAQGRWNDNHAPVACRATGALGTQPGGAARWRGCNVIPAALSTGAACLPVECGVFSGDSITDEFLP